MYYFLFLILSLLWIFDLAQTLRSSRERGIGVEENPLARFLLKKSRVDFILFKLVDLALLGTIMGLIWTDHEGLAEGMLLSFIALYVVTVIHNHNVQKRG